MSELFQDNPNIRPRFWNRPHLCGRGQQNAPFPEVSVTFCIFAITSAFGNNHIGNTMRKIFVLFMAITLVACSKISQSDLQGNWYVGSILTQEITSNTDSGWASQEGLSAVFHVHEILTFKKNVIIPCPSSDAMLESYDDYKGEVNYTLSGTKLTIPEIHYAKYKEHSNGTVEASETTYSALSFEVATNGKRMELTGTSEVYDNLGNVKKRINMRIELSKTDLSNEDK